MELKAKFVMAINDYKFKKKRNWEKGIDYVALDNDSKVLIRVITNPSTPSKNVSIDTVRKMAAVLEEKDYDDGVLISERFTQSARRELNQSNIQMISEKHSPSFTPKTIYVTIQDCVDDLCKLKCGAIPKKKADCKGFRDQHYSCRVRQISDNALFHLKKGWSNLLEDDLMRLLDMKATAKKE
jgi:hypothetical protein